MGSSPISSTSAISDVMASRKHGYQYWHVYLYMHVWLVCFTAVTTSVYVAVCVIHSSRHVHSYLSSTSTVVCRRTSRSLCVWNYRIHGLECSSSP